MLLVESGTLPHRPWTPMSLVNGRVPASEALREGWSEAEVCAEEVAASRKPMRLQRGRACRSREAAPASSRSSYRQGRRTAHREAAPSAKQGTIGTSILRTGTFGRATSRTSSIGKSTFWQIMVPNGQMLRGERAQFGLFFEKLC